ncbi:MAG: ABC transporter substrate-binding protein, partial [Burkholderiales bacterium]
MQKNFLIILLVGLLALVGCGDGGSGTDDSGKIIKIGHVAPLTGPISHLGKDNERGAQLAIDEANAAGITIGGEKVEFRLLSEDDEANPQKGTVVAQKLVDSGVAGVIGHLNSGTTIPA